MKAVRVAAFLFSPFVTGNAGGKGERCRFFVLSFPQQTPFMSLVEALIIAFVEGLTEFIPISSTAHMIFASTAMGIQEDEFVKMFQVSIQFGAILAVVVLYWRKFFDFKNPSFYFKLALAVLPGSGVGLPAQRQNRRIAFEPTAYRYRNDCRRGNPVVCRPAVS